MPGRCSSARAGCCRSRPPRRNNSTRAQAGYDQASGELRRVQAQIAQKRIVAPFDGRLGLRKVNLGQFVRSGDALVSLTDARTLLATITLPEAALPALQRNQQVLLNVDAAWPGRAFEARLSAIEPQIGSDTRTVRLQAAIDNADGALAPGMYVKRARGAAAARRRHHRARDRHHLQHARRLGLRGAPGRQGRGLRACSSCS